jgi:hypothetical protein
LEIRIRRFALILVGLLAVAVLAPYAIPRLDQPIFRDLPWGKTTPAPLSAVLVPPGGPEITFGDASLGWDWQSTCAGPFAAFLADKLAGQPIHAVEVALVDYGPDTELPFGVRYPDEAGAQADASCHHLGGGRYRCSVGVARGEPGPDLDVAATLAAPYTLLDIFLARGPEPDETRKRWRWGTFQPLIAPIEEADNRWRSTCLHISRAP